MNMYEARWKNAIRIAENINKMLTDGYIVYDSEGVRVGNKFKVTSEEITHDGNDGNIIYFTNNNNQDMGALTTIKEYNKEFEKWLCVDPKHILKVI